MVVLDTDHLSILDTDTQGALNIGRRLSGMSPEEVSASIITYEEQMRGWLAYIARANTLARQIEAYSKLHQHVERFRFIPTLGFDAEAASYYEHLQKSRVRIGTMDLKIAAVCLAHNATLLTRNLKDFRQVPGLTAEDWSE